MKRALTGPLLAVTLLCTLTLVAHAAGGIRWSRSLNNAMARAKKTNQLVMVDFYTDWCGWCKRLDQDTFRNKQVVSLAGSMVSVKLNAEKEGAAAAQKYRVNGFPTVLFLNRKGQMVGRLDGYLPPGDFARYMRQVAQAHKKAPK